jgi:hypothetical protein
MTFGVYVCVCVAVSNVIFQLPTGAQRVIYMEKHSYTYYSVALYPDFSAASITLYTVHHHNELNFLVGVDKNNILSVIWHSSERKPT